MQNLLGDLTKEEFLKEYWQQKPLVIRGAFADFEMPFDAAELAGLACDTEAPSRIIVEKGLAPDFKAWTSKHSPFTDEDFINTPDSHWTFLVNDLERYVPELGNLIEPFRFIPDWRIDDLMVSYAADQGSVGPHVDAYDVFLIQGEGKRRWKINTNPDYPKDLIPDTSLAILENFSTDEEWLLEKGDMLYLPPNMPHYGIAEGECFTFSVGFRAPSILDMTQSWIESFGETTNNDQLLNTDINTRFEDAGRSPQDNPGEINTTDLQTLTDQIIATVDKQKQNLPIFIGKYLTENRGEQGELETNDEMVLDDQDYERQSGLRIAYTEDSRSIHLFASGNHLELPLSLKTAVQELCENFYYTSDSLKILLNNNDFRNLFQQLLSQGSVFPPE